ncbi:MAG: S-layer homology domain-containing protein, partial [Candidatus Gracilibacteria bacterium]|nr:S-layer homology domain-containing protein [Candidatus Gracilibacteria bacterium]
NVYKASKYVLDKGIMKGFGDNSFKPENSITRKEALLTIFRTFNIDTNSQIKYDFSDISKTDTFKNYIDKAIELKILGQQKNFRPNDQVTRYEFIAMFIRAYKYSNKETINYAGKNRFTDLLKNSPFYNEVNIFGELLRLNAGYINGSEIMKRGEVSKIIYSFYKFNG